MKLDTERIFYRWNVRGSCSSEGDGFGICSVFYTHKGKLEILEEEAETLFFYSLTWEPS